MARSFKIALREYFKAYKLRPEEPIINLCIGIKNFYQCHII